MNQVSQFRLHVLRALYLLIVLGLVLTLWPQVFAAQKTFAHWEFFRGVETCMMAAFWLLCVLGIRYPLQLLPILIWELIWKTIWLLTVPLPLWFNGTLDAKLLPNVFAIGMVVLVYLALPWPYVVSRYLKQQGDPWRKGK